MDEGVNQGRDLALDDEVAGRLKVGDDLSQASAELKRAKDEFFMLLLYNVFYFVLTCLMKSTISCSVVSLVMNWSMSVMMSTQMSQVSSFLDSGRAEAPRKKRARQRKAFSSKNEIVFSSLIFDEFLIELYLILS